ncbi:hypothetical protein DSECCO2_295900 [anaerobic digester metagenome]
MYCKSVGCLNYFSHLHDYQSNNYNMRKSYYPCNLTEKQWSLIENIIEPNNKRKRKHALRDILTPFSMW